MSEGHGYPLVLNKEELIIKPFCLRIIVDVLDLPNFYIWGFSM